MMLVVYGPTATGKTALALKIAKKYNGELVSADSRQVYKHLDIGTGKVSFDSKVEKHNGYWKVNDIKIHGFDLIEPEKRFSAFDFLIFAKNSIVQIKEQNKLPIIVGGTGFYIKTLIEGLGTQGVPPNWELRLKLEKLTLKELFQQLVKINLNKANQLNVSDRQNPRRIARAIEVSYSNYKLKRSKLTSNKYLMIGLTAPNIFLYKKADYWLASRVKFGLLEEVESLLKSGIDRKWLENLGLEYRWLTKLALGKIGKREALERLKGDIHSFIRRQKTYFRQFPAIELYDISKNGSRYSLEKRIESAS